MIFLYRFLLLLFSGQRDMKDEIKKCVWHVTWIPGRQPNERPGDLPKSRIVIMLPHVQLSTKVARSNNNNGTSVLSSGLKIKRNHLFIMKNVTIHCCLDGRWHCDSNLFMLWLWGRCNKLGFCGLLSKSDHSRKFRWSYYRTALSSFPCR